MLSDLRIIIYNINYNIYYIHMRIYDIIHSLYIIFCLVYTRITKLQGYMPGVQCNLRKFYLMHIKNWYTLYTIHVAIYVLYLYNSGTVLII